MANKIQLPRTIFDQLTTIRDEGKYNMFEFHSVQREAHDKKFYGLVTWMEDNKDEYIQVIMHGAEMVEDGEDW